MEDRDGQKIEDRQRGWTRSNTWWFLRQFSDLTVYELVELFKWFMSKGLTDQIGELMDWWTRALEPAVGGLTVGAGGGSTGVGAEEQWSQQ